jgi:hypothetical protein
MQKKLLLFSIKTSWLPVPRRFKEEVAVLERKASVVCRHPIICKTLIMMVGCTPQVQGGGGSAGA